MEAQENLHDAERWLAQLRVSGTTLFRPETQPSVTVMDLLQADFRQENPSEIWRGIERAVGESCVKRRQSLRKDMDDQRIGEGRLLLYFPELEAAWQLNSSSAIVDAYNVPAWDTWIWAFLPENPASEPPDAALLAWIPSWYLRDADEAIACSMGTLLWIDDDRAHRVRPRAAELGLVQ